MEQYWAKWMVSKPAVAEEVEEQAEAEQDEVDGIEKKAPEQKAEVREQVVDAEQQPQVQVQVQDEVQGVGDQVGQFEVAIVEEQVQLAVAEEGIEK